MTEESTVYRTADEIDFDIREIDSRERFDQVMMVEPEYFEVKHSLNDLTSTEESVDKKVASEQWNALKEKYEELGFPVNIVPGVDGLTDMVFAANQSLPFIENGKRKAVLSNMATEQRADEVKYIEDWYGSNGFELESMDPGHDFEGMGDAIWHPERKLIWGGHGHRTSEKVYDEISQVLGVDVVTLELPRDEFYHLDTCFSALDEETVMICPETFSQEGIEKIERLWENIIRVGLNESVEGLACNAHCPDGESVIIQKGNKSTNRKLREHGFTVHEVDTSEFIKSGGSVFCMKLMIPGGEN